MASIHKTLDGDTLSCALHLMPSIPLLKASVDSVAGGDRCTGAGCRCFGRAVLEEVPSRLSLRSSFRREIQYLSVEEELR